MLCRPEISPRFSISDITAKGSEMGTGFRKSATSDRTSSARRGRSISKRWRNRSGSSKSAFRWPESRRDVMRYAALLAAPCEHDRPAGRNPRARDRADHVGVLDRGYPLPDGRGSAERPERPIIGCIGASANRRRKNILSAMRVFSLILLPVVLAGGVVDHPEVLGQERLFDSWIRGQMSTRHLPGIAVGVVFDQQLIWAKGFGFADLGGKVPMTPSTT